MNTIDLECPGCDTLLELDRGFAGGVCRCSHCGTLMTVPEEGAAHAERLERPAAPGDERIDRPDAPTRDAGPQTFRTASGRTVTVEHLDRVPMAPTKRHVVRAATAVGFFAVVLGVLGLCAFAAYTMLIGPAEETHTPAYVETFTHDPDANPFEIEAPNLFGLPLAERVAVVLDVTELDPASRDAVVAFLRDGLGRRAPGVRVAVWINQPEAEYELTFGWQALPVLDSAVLLDRLRSIPSDQPGSELLRVAEDVAKENPGVVVFVTGRRVGDAEAEALRGLLPGVRIDAVMLDADSFAMEDLARATGGHYVTLDADDEFQRWLPQAVD